MDIEETTLLANKALADLDLDNILHIDVRDSSDLINLRNKNVIYACKQIKQLDFIIKLSWMIIALLAGFGTGYFIHGLFFMKNNYNEISPFLQGTSGVIFSFATMVLIFATLIFQQKQTWFSNLIQGLNFYYNERRIIENEFKILIEESLSLRTSFLFNIYISLPFDLRGSEFSESYCLKVLWSIIENYIKKLHENDDFEKFLDMLPEQMRYYIKHLERILGKSINIDRQLPSSRIVENYISTLMYEERKIIFAVLKFKHKSTYDRLSENGFIC